MLVRTVSVLFALVLGVHSLGAQFIVRRPPPVVQGSTPTRVFVDTVESGSLNAVWHDNGTPCTVVSSSDDAVAVVSGSFQMRCNWDGDNGVPFGHSHTEQWIEGGDLPWTSEYLVRFRYRHDANVDHVNGAKFMRPSYDMNGPDEGDAQWAWIIACNYADLSDGWWMGEGLPGSDYDIGPACSVHDEHEMEYYVYKHASAGQIKVWTDGTHQITYTGDTSGITLSLNMLSNWSLNEGWDHDALNTVYVDDFEIFSDATSGTPAAGSLSEGTIAVP